MAKLQWNRDRDRWLHWAAGMYAAWNIDNQPRDDKEYLRRIEMAVSAWYAEGMDDGISEIEAIFHAFALFATDGYQPIEYDMFDGVHGEPEWGTYYRRQQRIGRYTADFVFTIIAGEHRRQLVVECDGHDFHERTKEQAAHDRGRDREMGRMGYQVMRFTGAELFRDPVKCIQEVEAVINDLLDECMAAAGIFKSIPKK